MVPHVPCNRPSLYSHGGRIVSFATLIVVAVMAWLEPKMAGDAFMTLAGGQDVFAGKLGSPDDWSFTTSGRIWINQNWGTGVLFYITHALIGDAGLAVLKAIFILTMATFLVHAARQFGADYPVSLLVAAAALMASRQYFNIRANLVGLTFVSALLWMLYWSASRPQRVWWIVPLLTVWAHMHGSFILGLAMLGLWTACTFAVLKQTAASPLQLRQHWHLPAATVVALCLVVLTSPFGLQNLTQPFALIWGVEGEAWPVETNEMKPIFKGVPGSAIGPRQFFLMLGLVAAPALAWVFHRQATSRRLLEVTDPQRAVEIIFTVALLIVVIVMSFRSRRFIPIALLVATPLIALEFQWLLNSRALAWPAAVLTLIGVAWRPLLDKVSTWSRADSLAQEPIATDAPHNNAFGMDERLIWPLETLVLVALSLLAYLIWRFGRSMWADLLRNAPALSSLVAWLTDQKRRGWTTVVLSAVMLIGLLTRVPDLSRYYNPVSPFYPQQTVGQRMIVYSHFPADAAKFINDNQIEGHVFNDWRWEGFLRWHCPQLKFFVGGRSRQIYTPAAFKQWMLIGLGRELDELPRLDVHLMIVGSKHEKLSRALMVAPNSTWAVIYYDRKTTILASRHSEKTQRLIENAATGRLKYPTPALAKISRAMCLMSSTVQVSSSDMAIAVREANLASPTPEIYALLAHMMSTGKLPAGWLTSYLEYELRRLETIDFHKSDGYRVLESRLTAASILDAIYSKIPHKEKQSKFWQDYAKHLRAAASALHQAIPEPPIPIIPSTGTGN